MTSTPTTSTLDLTTLKQTLLTLAQNNTGINDMVNQTYNALFSGLGLSSDVQTQINNVLSLIEQYGSNNTTITTDDFTNFVAAVKQNPFVVYSFISAVVTQGIALYNDAKQYSSVPAMSQETKADFIFRMLVFVIVVPVIKTQTTSQTYFVTNVDTIFEILTIVYSAYNTFFTSGEFSAVEAWLKQKFSALSSCCRPRPANAQTPAAVQNATNRHMSVVKLAVENQGLKTKLQSLTAVQTLETSS
jgi:hypothetical protein